MTTFHTEPQGEPLTFDLGGALRCTKQSLGQMDNNGYLLRAETGPSVWIDAAAEAEVILGLLEGSSLDTVVTTHRHHDHIGATAAVLSSTGAEGLCGTPDVKAIEADTGTTQRGVWDGDTVAVGGATLDVIGIVGHTPGSITLAWAPKNGPAHLFTGDSLFPRGPGRAIGVENFTQLMDDLEAKVFARFPDSTVVHPGHGDATTLGIERPHLAEWRARGW